LLQKILTLGMSYDPVK